jgi:hypothetical protein
MVRRVLGVRCGMDQASALWSHTQDAGDAKAAHRVNDHHVAGLRLAPIQGRARRDDLVWNPIVGGHL